MSETEPKLTKNEIIKAENPSLAGNIGVTLHDPEAEMFDADDQQFLKFHGIYQQDDRDVRKQGKKYMFMIRGRIPGGVVSPEVYLTYDRVSEEFANKTLRVTTRQSFQFHGVVKSGLGPLMKGINEALSDTLAACGDVNRNVLAPPTPSTSRLTEQVYEDAKRVSDALLPTTKAYHQIWVEGQPLKLEDDDHEDPLYGKTYLPRKFKVAFAIPPLNDTDILANCLGFIAIEENGELIGYNLAAGGGMGMSHNNEKTYPRVADVVGFLKPEHLIEFSKAVLTVHRDFGDRTNRKHARLKYVIAEQGVDWFRKEVSERAGVALEDPRPFEFTQQGDVHGWHEQYDGNLFLGLHVLAGRVKDTEQVKLKSALRQIVTEQRTEVRLTAAQNIVLANVAPDKKDAIDAILKEHGVDTTEKQGVSEVQLGSMACPALPTCGLSLAESERYLPDLLGTVENLLEDNGLGDERVILRMTGCPNGCARPYMAELGFVGRRPNMYALYLGGNEEGTRLSRLYDQNVKVDELPEKLGGLFARFKAERDNSERFGDFCARVVWPEQDVA